MRIRVTREAKVAITATEIRAVVPGEIDLPDDAAQGLIDAGAAEPVAGAKSGPVAAASPPDEETPPPATKPATVRRKGAAKAS